MNARIFTQHHACLRCEQAFTPFQIRRARRFCSTACRTAFNRDCFADLFWSKVTKTDDCWIWTSAKNASGYGVVNYRDRARLAHRVAYELIHGHQHKDACILHRCDNPPCVRPDHLFLGDRRDNSQDMIAKGRHNMRGLLKGTRGDQHGFAKLTSNDIADIRYRYAAGGVRYRDLADKYGVHPVTIGDVIRGTTWKHIP
jgi:hypothetical protein